MVASRARIQGKSQGRKAQNPKVRGAAPKATRKRRKSARAKGAGRRTAQSPTQNPAQRKTTAPSPATPNPNLLVSKLAEAAWEQADAALAQALADFDEWETASDAAARKAAREMLGQSLAQAARRRGLVRVGELGATAPFDPAAHELTVPAAKAPKIIAIRARGVARGAAILIRPRVGFHSRSTKAKGSAKRSIKG